MQNTQHTTPLNSRIGQILNSLPFYTAEELAAKPEPMKLFGNGFPLRQRTTSDGRRPYEYRAGLDVANILTTERQVQWDELLAPIAPKPAIFMQPEPHPDVTPAACNIESGYLTMPDWEMFPLDRSKFGDTQPPVDHSLVHDVAFEFTAEELMEEYMEAQKAPVTVADVGIADVAQPRELLEDTFVHQLISPACLVTQAVTLLRLLEDDVRMMETVRTMSIDDAITPNASSVWGSKLNALVHLNHHKLVKVLNQIKADGKVQALMDSLTRMEYSNSFDPEKQLLSLRHKAHAKYGIIVI